jgi:uncharacterized protein (DUF1015 family)
VRLRPFRALGPPHALAPRVVSPPYDVVSRREAAALAAGNPLSFLHVGRSDIDLPEDVDPHDPRVYAAARASLDRFIAEGTLRRGAEPAVYVYRQVMAGRAQIGVVACVHVDDYEREVIRKHEHTRPDKEDDRTRHVLALGAHAEPVFLVHRDAPAVARLVAGATAGDALHDFPAADGVRHTVWRAPEPEAYVDAFAAVPRAYVADGHHRSASAARAARELRAERGRSGDSATPAGADWFLAVLFPASHARILPYNRVVADLGGQTAAEVRARLARVGRLGPAAEPMPARPGTFGLYFGAANGWERLELPAASVDRADPIRSLDVSLLQERVLGPVLGIGDPRTDPRIDFVGGIRGAGELARRVDSGAAALAISMYPTTMEQVMAVADAGHVMPPKSTWFEPKLLSGLFVHELSD